MATASTDLAEAGAEERGQYAPGWQLREPPHGSRSDDDFDGNQRLLGRLAALTTERIDVELKRIPRSRDRLSPCPPVHVTAGDLGDRGDEAAVRFPVDRDDVSKPRPACASPSHAEENTESPGGAPARPTLRVDDGPVVVGHAWAVSGGVWSWSPRLDLSKPAVPRLASRASYWRSNINVHPSMQA